MSGLALLLVGLTAGFTPLSQALWQADLQIQSLTVTENHGTLSAKVIVGSESGKAVTTRVEVQLPVGDAGNGRMAGPSPPGVSALRTRVVYSFGNLPATLSRESLVVTTTPPTGVSRGFGVLAVSDTPDPRPGNNFAEKAIPRPAHSKRLVELIPAGDSLR